MKTSTINRNQKIKGLLTKVVFEVDGDSAAFNYEDKEIYLDVIQWFDGSDDLVIDFQENGQPAELTNEEKEVVFKALCSEYDTYQNNKIQEDREADYDAMTTQDTYNHINRNFHLSY